jgi:hypothetical protein
MIELLSAGANLPFLIALALMVTLAVLEGVGLLLGAGLSELLNHALPDLDVDLDVDLDADLDVDADLDLEADVDAAGAAHGGEIGGAHTADPSGWIRFLGWLHVGRVPVLALLVIFLTSFGLLGLLLQMLSRSLWGGFLPGVVASVAALFASLPVVRTAGGWMAWLVPKDETSVVSEVSFIGRVAVVTLGTARRGCPAQAKLRDRHGQTHYVLVEPDREGTVFETGSAVLLVERKGAVFEAILNPSPALVD